MKENKNKKSKKVQAIINQWRDRDYINSDTLGSYTGTPDDEDMRPIQDADDL